jgi:hypothetical protein
VKEAYSSVPYWATVWMYASPSSTVTMATSGFSLACSVGLIRLPVFLDRDLRPLLDVQRVVVAELVLAGAADDLAADAESVGEAGELDVLDLDGDVEVFAFATRVAEVLLGALDAPGGVALDEVARFEHVREVPEVVDVLGDERHPLAPLLAATPAYDAHVGSRRAGVTCLVIRTDRASGFAPPLLRQPGGEPPSDEVVGGDLDVKKHEDPDDDDGQHRPDEPAGDPDDDRE